MSRNYLRSCDVRAGSLSWSYREGDDLNIAFEIKMGDTQYPQIAEVTVTNPRDVKALPKMGEAVEINGGFIGNSGLLFKGQVFQARTGRSSPTDTYFSVVATSRDTAANFAVVNKTLAAGHTFKDQVEACLEVMKPFGIEVGFIADLGSKKFPRARTLFGMARDRLREIANATDTSWSVQNDTFQMIANKGSLPGGAIVLNSRTGLIGRPVETLEGVLARCLINPRIKPGTMIHIDEKKIDKVALSPSLTHEIKESQEPTTAADGMYRCYFVEHRGETRGQPWYCDVTCLRADGEGPAPISGLVRGIELPEFSKQ